MLFWIVMAVLTAAACLSVLVPLYRGRSASGAANPAVAIYKDQLGELDRDVGRGLIGEGEAAAARTEISRRLLRADDAASPAPGQASATSIRPAILAAIVLIPVAAVGLYLFLGSPQMPDMPLEARLNTPPDKQDVAALVTPPDKQDIAALVARVETYLATHPEDGRGWELLGPVYQRLGRMDDAQRAFANALRLLGSTPEREADLGEAIMHANDGAVTSEARAAFDRALALDPKSLRARFFLALALGQEGRKEEALAAWRSLLAEAPTDGPPWVEMARRAMGELEGAGKDTGPAVASGPSAADVDAAAQMTPEARTAMISGMVGQLAARLKTNPSDAEGWARLIRSYMVLNRAEDARAALGSAHDALAGDAAKLAVVDEAARGAGIAP